MNPTDAYRKELRKKELKRVILIIFLSCNIYVFVRSEVLVDDLGVIILGMKTCDTI